MTTQFSVSCMKENHVNGRSTNLKRKSSTQLQPLSVRPDKVASIKCTSSSSLPSTTSSFPVLFNWFTQEVMSIFHPKPLSEITLFLHDIQQAANL